MWIFFYTFANYRIVEGHACHFMKVRIVFTLLSICLTFSVCVSAQQESAGKALFSATDSVVNSLYQSGKAYFMREEYAMAVETFSRVLFLKPDMAKAYNDRGSCYRRLNLYEKAVADYTDAIRYKPCAAYYCNRGSARLKMENIDEAIADYSIAIAIDTTYVRAYNNRGYAHLLSGSYRRAIEDFSVCIRRNPSNYKAYNNRGIAYYKTKDFDLSILDFDKAISLKDDYGIAYLHRGNLKEMLDDDAGACEDWTKAAAMGVKQAEGCLKNCDK